MLSVCVGSSAPDAASSVPCCRHQVEDQHQVFTSVGCTRCVSAKATGSAWLVGAKCLVEAEATSQSTACLLSIAVSCHVLSDCALGACCGAWVVECAQCFDDSC